MKTARNKDGNEEAATELKGKRLSSGMWNCKY
jgi:hypothetical protein